MTKKISSKSISELRQDIVSGTWVVIATGRARRPYEFLQQKRPQFKQPVATCPFEKLHRDALAAYSLDGERGRSRRGVGIPTSLSKIQYSASGENWWVEAVPNKYPAFGKGICSLFHKVGPYQWTEGVGFHELVISRKHDYSLGEMSDEEAELVMKAYQDRSLVLKDEPCVEYVSIFHNHGRNSGATISHPHSQLMAIPVIPPDIGHSLEGSARYFHKNKNCVHCVVLEYELKIKERIIYQNGDFVVLAPFASKTAFEIRIFPRRHNAHFETMVPGERKSLANALRTALAKLFRGLNNPDYNFFLHTAPTGDSHEFHHYHWHFEILPKTAIWAGFEIGTGIEISTITPENAAKFLKNIKVK